MDVVIGQSAVGDGEPLAAVIARLERQVARERAARKQAEGLIEAKSRELWEQRERYRLLAENASDVVIHLARDYTIIWVSPSIQDILGWSPPVLTGSSVGALVHPDDLSAVLHARDHLVAGVGSVEEFRFKRSDGRYMWMAGRSRQLRDGAEGAVVGWVVALRDVDELVLARRAVMADRERLKATLDSLLDPHVLLVAVRDAMGSIVDFTYESANDSACEYMRMAREDLQGAKLLDLLPGQAGSGMLAMYARSVESGEPLALDDYAYPHELLDDERRYDIRAIRVGDGLSFTWRDVTDRFAAAQALAEKERQYRLLAENAGDVVVRTRDGLALWISPSAEDVLGWAPEALLGTDLTALIHPDDLHQIAPARQELKPGQTGRLRYRLLTGAGDYRWVQANTRVWVDDDDRVDGTVATIRDINEEMNALQALEYSEERYRLLAVSSSDVVMHVRDGLILWVSPALRDMLGWSPEEWIGTLLDDVIHPEDLDRLLQARADIRAGAAIVQRFRARDRDGVYHWIETHARPYRDASGVQEGAAVSFRTVDAEVRADLELERRAHFDELTGLVNRNHLFEQFGSILANQRRPGIHPAVIFIDVDEFKEVNDTYGHAAGDELLRSLASRITTSVRSSDVTARVGGDELVVVLAGVHTLDEAVAIAEKIRRSARQDVAIVGGTLNATVSIGVTMAKPDETVDAIIARADAGMYLAKARGRDQVIPIP